MSDTLNLNPYAGQTYAELCGRRKDYARLKDAAVATRKEAERHLDLIGKAMENCRPSRGIEASDHAVVRYLERVKGVDVDALRAEMADQVRRGTQIASERIRGGRMKEIYVINGDGFITTVLPADALIASIKKDIRERPTRDRDATPRKAAGFEAAGSQPGPKASPNPSPQGPTQA